MFNYMTIYIKSTNFKNGSKNDKLYYADGVAMHVRGDLCSPINDGDGCVFVCVCAPSQP